MRAEGKASLVRLALRRLTRTICGAFDTTGRWAELTGIRGCADTALCAAGERCGLHVANPFGP